MVANDEDESEAVFLSWKKNCESGYGMFLFCKEFMSTQLKEQIQSCPKNFLTFTLLNLEISSSVRSDGTRNFAVFLQKDRERRSLGKNLSVQSLYAMLENLSMTHTSRSGLFDNNLSQDLWKLVLMMKNLKILL